MLTEVEPSTKLQLSVDSEFVAYARDQFIESTYLNCSFRAPVCPEGDRKPVDIVVVLDRSGSMAGSKLDLCKKTIQFLMGELSSQDRLGLVTYDTNVKTEFHLMKMNEKGKEETEGILQKIKAGSSTNLSGGLFHGIQEVQRQGWGFGFGFGLKGDKPNPVRSVLLLTDGEANKGITSTEKIVEVMKGTLEPNVSVFTFGYGSDHNVDMLREIADVGGGVYYFVQSVDGVSLAFADCLGGLLSVVAQNIKLECFGMNGCKIESIKTRKATNAIVPNKHYEIEMGDLYGEEGRDVLIEVSMPTLPAENMEFVALECRLSYVNVLDSSLDKVEVCGVVQRLNEVPADQAPNSCVTQQRNRIIAVEALEQADEAAKKGRLDEGKIILQTALDRVTCNLKLLNEDDQTGSAGLIDDLKECRGSLASMSVYEKRGLGRMRAKVQSHWAQRSNDAEAEDEEELSKHRQISASTVGSSAFGYRNTKKMNMMTKSRFVPESARTMSIKIKRKALNRPDGRYNVLQYIAVDAVTDKEITMESWIRLISDPDSSDVARQMTDILKNAPYEAFRFETPGVSPNTLSLMSFEFVLVEDSYLASFGSTPDKDAFAEFLTSPSCNDGSKSAGCVFTNLGGDATLVAPRDWSPESSPSLYSSSYGHLANFVRGAPEEQVLKMWQTVGNVLKEKYLDHKLSSSEADTPKWFSTAGGGVAWFHFRLDSRPKYYHYVPYKALFGSS